MGKEILTFDNTEIEKKKFTAINFSPIFLKDVDFEKVLISKKVLFGEKKL